MGLFEVLHHLPRLLALRSRIRSAMLERRPDVFVGIDAPEFNLGLAPALHAAGLRTVQYVSPQVWAWRRGRAARMARFLDLVLCLLPFERGVYDAVGLRSIFVGHPLADQLPLEPDAPAARRALGLPDSRPRRRRAARQPDGRGVAARRRFRGDGRLARRAAAGPHVRRGTCRRDDANRLSRRRSRGTRRASRVHCFVGPVAGGPHGGQRRARRFRHGDARDAPVQAAHGRRLSPGRADRLCAAAASGS